MPPPDNLSTLNPIFFNLDQECIIVRIYKNHRKPFDFNYTGPRSRFDHHRSTLGNPQEDTERGVYYAAPIISSKTDAISSCLVECFGDSEIIPRISKYNICSAEISRRLNLLDLRGDGAICAGSVSALTAIADRKISQQWSRYFYENIDLYSLIDGIIYHNAHNEKTAVVLYERAENSLTYSENLPLNHSSLRPVIQDIAKTLRIVIPPEEWL